MVQLPTATSITPERVFVITALVTSKVPGRVLMLASLTKVPPRIVTGPAMVPGIPGAALRR